MTDREAEVNYISDRDDLITHKETARPSSPVPSQDSVKTDYALLLSRVPGFEGYARQGSESRDGTFPTYQSQVAGDESGTKNGLRGRSVSFRTPLAQRWSQSISGTAPILEQLKRISRKRDNLMELQSRIKALSREIASLRKDLSRTVKQSDSIASRVDADVVDLSQHWQLYQNSLHGLLGDIGDVEAELEPLQEELTGVQYSVKVAEDKLYASLTGGAHPADSDADDEDQMLMSALLNYGDTRIVDLDLLREDIDPYEAPLRPVQERDILESFALRSGIDDASEVELIRNRDGSRSRRQSPAKKPNPRKRSVEVGAAKNSDRPLLPSAALEADTIIDLIAHCGSWAPEADDLRPQILASSQNSYLIAAKELKVVRRNDFRAVLGYDIDRLTRDLSLVDSLKPGEAPSVAQKLAHINVETIHTRQLISLWGREMSQNSPLELSRTQLYGKQDVLDLLRRQGHTAILLKLVADVRKLEVPIDTTDVTDKPLITVGNAMTDNGPESIMVQLSDINSSSVRTASKQS